MKSGGDTWFFLTADYAFGHALERDTSAVIAANGGKILGSVKHPLNNADFSSFLLQAQNSKAKIVGLANAGGDTTNAIKQAAEFGIVAGGQKLAGMLMFITDVNSLGLNVAQGLNFTETFYWDIERPDTHLHQTLQPAFQEESADHDGPKPEARDVAIRSAKAASPDRSSPLRVCRQGDYRFARDI